MTKKPKHFRSEYVEELIRNLPRCKHCGQQVYSNVDRSKSSKLVEWKGIQWTKEHPQKMWMFPSGKFPRLCDYCESKLHPPKVGRKS